MGKKRIAQLLDQLHTNHQADLKNAAQIFTVAQVAVNQLNQQVEINQQAETAPLALPPLRFQSPTVLDQAVLKQRYGNFNACRKAARQLGIQFHSTPTWTQLVVAFSYFDALQNLIQDYTAAFPNDNLQNITMAFKLRDGGAENRIHPKF